MKNKYEQIADMIEERISCGKYTADEFLPGERVLCDEFQVSRVTIRNGLNILKHRRVIQPLTGKGYIIVKNKNTASKPLTHLIGGVFPGPKYPLSTTITSESISNVLEEKGFHLIYSSSGESLSAEISKIEALIEKGIDGLILMPSYRRGANELSTTDELGNHEYVKKLYDSGFPVVIIDRSYSEGGIPCVCNDDVKGGYMATEYFIEKGFKEIVYFAPVVERIGRRRFQGYCDAMKKHGLKTRKHTFKNPQSVLFYDEERSREVKNLIKNLEQDTAIITGGFLPSNLSAVIRTPNYKGPDVQWIGYVFGAHDMTGTCQKFPYLKSPMFAIGERAAGKILRLIEGDKTATTEDFLSPEIIQS